MRAGRQLEHVHAAGAGTAEPGGRPLVDCIDLLARMSHDLRTPLNAVIGFSDVMQQELFGPLGDARYRDYARHIRTSGDLLLRAAEDALAMTAVLAASSARASSHAVPLQSLVAQTLAEARARLEHLSIDVEVEVQPGLEVEADAGSVRHAVRHLLRAALARAAPSARLRVQASGQLDQARLTLRIEAPAESPVAVPRLALERGLGREELSLMLARVLFELQGIALTVDQAGPSFTATVAFERATQPDFFGLC